MSELGSITLVGNQHPLSVALKELLPVADPVPWAAPATEPAGEALVLMPPIWTAEPDAPEAVLDDLSVVHAWLHDWVPVARHREGGSILYVVSLDGVCGTAENVLLSERDSALLAQARAMAMELGRFGIRSNCLALGPLVRTGEEGGEAHLKNPLKRQGTFQEAAGVAAFLAGPAAAHVSGQLLVHAGGADVGRIVP